MSNIKNTIDLNVRLLYLTGLYRYILKEGYTVLEVKSQQNNHYLVTLAEPGPYTHIKRVYLYPAEEPK